MKIKALHLISGGDAGGAKTHIYSLMKGFNGLVDAKIICFIKDKFYYDAKELGIDIEVLQQKNRFDISVMKDIADIVNTEEYDLVHCHGARANFNFLFLKKHIKVPNLTTIHSDYLLDFKDSFVKNLIFTPLNTFALKKFDNYIAITQNFKGMLEERGFSSESIYVAYNGIDLDREEVFVPKEEFLERYNIDYNGELLFGIAARLDHVKDHKTLLKSIANIKEKTTSAKFLIAGSGAAEGELKNMTKELGIEDKVVFLGHVNDPYSLFNAIDINMLTSISESFPYAILEGAKMRCPIISTAVGGIPELVEDGVNGYLFEPGNTEKLSELILKFIENSSLAVTMGSALYEKVSQDYTEIAMGQRHYSIYSEILKKFGGRK